MIKDPKISELTVSQLKRLIRETVQEAVAEVIIEVNAIAQAEEEDDDDADLADFLHHLSFAEMMDSTRLDD